METKRNYTGEQTTKRSVDNYLRETQKEKGIYLEKDATADKRTFD